MTTATATVRVERQGPAIVLTLDAPPRNVLSIAVLDELDRAVRSASAQPGDARALVLRANGKCFSAGADVAEHLPDKVARMLVSFHRALLALHDAALPTYALVDGLALGGACELVAVCDFVIATDRSTFGQPEVKLAALAPVASAVLPAIVGPREAMRLIVTGAVVTAREARDLGLVAEVVPGAEDLDAALARQLAPLGGTSPAITGLIARTVRQQAHPDLHERIRQLEQVYLREVATHPDSSEGLRAFLEKRAPVWAPRAPTPAPSPTPVSWAGA